VCQYLLYGSHWVNKNICKNGYPERLYDCGFERLHGSRYWRYYIWHRLFWSALISGKRYSLVLLSGFDPQVYPAGSSDLMSLAYLLWPHMKDVIYRQKSRAGELLQKVMEHPDRTRGEKTKLSERHRIVFWDLQICAYRTG